MTRLETARILGPAAAHALPDAQRAAVQLASGR